jgi:DNA-binding NarL/FixJ family response regulator
VTYEAPDVLMGRCLSVREWQCVWALADGCTNPQIAARLGIRNPTVRNHLTHAYRKLGVGNRTEAAMKALRLGIVL